MGSAQHGNITREREHLSETTIFVWVFPDRKHPSKNGCLREMLPFPSDIYMQKIKRYLCIPSWDVTNQGIHYSHWTRTFGFITYEAEFS